MSMCKRCVHANVCGSEGKFDEALTYCDDFLACIPVSEGSPENFINPECGGRIINMDAFIMHLETEVPYFKGRHKGVLTLFKRLMEEYYEIGHAGD